VGAICAQARAHTVEGTAIAPQLRIQRIEPPARPGIDELAAVLRAAWDADTAWIEDWHPRNPPRGQCGSTAIVLQDLRGGALMRGLVEETPGIRAVHYWNVLDIGQVDLTWQQFPVTARIVLGERVDRSELLVNRWFVDRYETLRARVTGVAAVGNAEPWMTTS
jgi:hypothetical protein